MSRENVEIVRQGFEAWETGDLAGLLALLDPDLITRRLAPMPDPGTWNGPEGLLDVAADWMETFDDFTMKGEEFIDGGDHVVVRVAQGGRGADSGAPVTATFWFVYALRDRKVVSLDMYGTRTQALEAAGLRESRHQLIENAPWPMFRALSAVWALVVIRSRPRSEEARAAIARLLESP